MLTSIVFLSSAGALVLEIAAGRLIAPYVGMSLYTWTAIIAVVLAGLSGGHWLGGRMANRISDTASGYERMTAALGAASVFTLITLPLLRWIAEPLLSTSGGTVTAVVLLTSVLFFMPSFFVGVISPIATKIAIDLNPENAGHVLGRMFAAGAMGSILGTLSAGYFFISWIGTTGTVIAVAALYLMMAASMISFRRRSMLIVASLVTASLVAVGWGYTSSAYESPCHTESDYFCIRVEDASSLTGRKSRLMVLDHLVHSINDQNDPTRIASPYVHMVDEIVRLRFGDEGPSTAFFVGGGGFTLPRAWSAAFPNASLTVAEIDPAVTKVAEQDMWFEQGASTRVFHRDARLALRQINEPRTFDVIFGDAFHDIAIPAHLITHEFNDLVASKLNTGGIYALNVVDRAREPRFLYALVSTLRASFLAVEVWISNDVTLQDQRVTFIVVASDTPTPEGQIVAQRGFDRAWSRWPTSDLEERIQESDVPVMTDDFAPV